MSSAHAPSRRLHARPAASSGKATSCPHFLLGGDGSDTAARSLDRVIHTTKQRRIRQMTCKMPTAALVFVLVPVAALAQSPSMQPSSDRAEMREKFKAAC